MTATLPDAPPPRHVTPSWEAANQAEWVEDFATAWRMLDALPHPLERPGPPIAPWDGGPLSSADVLYVWKRFREIGADIRHASMLADVQRLPCGDVIVETDPRLIPLLARSYPRLRYTPRGPVPQPDAAVTVQATHERLGLLFRSRAADFPTQPGFLTPDPGRVSQSRAYRPRDGRPLIGLSWASSNAVKSLPTLDDWLPVLGRADASFVSLQYGATGHDIASLRRHGIDIVAPHDLDVFNDFDGLAALIAACDAVFTVSNSTAHLAGAVGVPTVVVLRDAPILAWPRGKRRTAWYPATRLAWCPADMPWRSWMTTHGATFSF